MKYILVLFGMVSFSAHADSWNGANNPANLNANYTYSFSQLPTTGTVDTEHMPWSDNYWESDWGGISLRWSSLTVNQRDPDLFEYQSVNREALFAYSPPTLAELKGMTRDQIANLSPAEKYDIFMGRYDYPTVHSERSRTSPDMDDWQGICHGWVPAAINQPEPQPVDVANADGVVVPFGSSDIKGLLSYYYGVDAYNFARGSREIVRNGNVFQVLDQVDAFDPQKWVSLASGALVFNSRGRQVLPQNMNDSAVCLNATTAASYGSYENCVNAYSFAGNADSLDLVAQVGSRSSGSDPNAGAFHVIMTNQLGLMHKAFAGNINKYLKRGQIWNQPVTGFTSVVDADHRDFRGGQVHVTTTLTYVSEIPQTWDAVVGTPQERFSTMVFSYSLDIDANGQITGGDWDNRYHPAFLWKHDKLPIQGYFTQLNSIYRTKQAMTLR